MKILNNKTLPTSSGIYLFKDKENTIIYIGKAKSIAKRVSSYFKKQYSDWKVMSLMTEYADIDFILTNTETEALLLEAQLIKEHKPKFNVLLKSGNPFLYILFTKDEPSQIKLVRTKKEKGTYFGPFLQKIQARKTYSYLIKTFRLFLCNKKIENGCLDFHLGKCAGSCKQNFDHQDYMFRIHLAIDALKNAHADFLEKIQQKIKEYNAGFEFEKSKHMHEYLHNIDTIFSVLKVRFTEHKFDHDIFAAITSYKKMEKPYEDVAHELQELLHLDKMPIRIDCFDISHFQSSYIVGSCVRFAFGKPDKNNFRHFNIRSLKEQNDYAALQEIVLRRYKNPLDIPDLVVIDGGKGQLNAIRSVLKGVEIISIAKNEEIVFSEKLPKGIHLDIKKNSGQLLIALRDYAHHFAISHHRNKRKKGQNS